MNDTTQPPEKWTRLETKTNGIVYTTGDDKIGYKFAFIDNTLIEQLQSEARIQEREKAEQDYMEHTLLAIEEARADERKKKEKLLLEARQLIAQTIIHDIPNEPENKNEKKKRAYRVNEIIDSLLDEIEKDELEQPVEERTPPYNPNEKQIDCVSSLDKALLKINTKSKEEKR